MRDRKTPELAHGVDAHSLQRLVSRRQIKHLHRIEKKMKIMLAQAACAWNKWGMTKLEQSQLRDGSRIVYDDGRGEAKATVLTVEHWGMCVQFDDRADTNTIRFADKAWMNFLSVDEI